MSCPYSTSEIPTFINSVKACISDQSTDCQALGTLNETLIQCNTEMQTIINGLNQSVLDMTIENNTLKASLIDSRNKNNVSGQLFMTYKQNYAVDYVRNWAMLIGIHLICMGIFQALSNTSEGTEIKNIIYPK